MITRQLAGDAFPDIESSLHTGTVHRDSIFIAIWNMVDNSADVIEIDL